MSRRHYLISYDVSDDKRRTKLFKMLEGQGDHAQYSVFFCDLNDAELALLRTRIVDTINNSEDQVLMLDLGPASNDANYGLEVLGTPYEPLTRTLVV
ncbi:MAG: CRISPR-associated endonuclease Cas2 [Anaerolineae bacterium]|nr:CRISPR-associated endonuclease Cas2 [Anaerolineae bacterium]